MVKKEIFLFIIIVFNFLSCEKETGKEYSEYIDTRDGVAVTGECIKVGCVSADAYIYVNTDSVMFATMEQGANIAGIQVCRDGLFANAEEVLPVPITTSKGYCVFFDTIVTNRALVHMKNLQPSSTYYYRAFAQIGKARLYGKARKFMTADIIVPINGFVDLGLSTKWAACNNGSSYPSDIGEKYTWSAGVSSCRQAGRMPSKAEWQELIDRCAYSVTIYNNQRGLLLTGPSGRSVFLPCVTYEPYREPSLPDDDSPGIAPIIGGEGFNGSYWASEEGKTFFFQDGYYDHVDILSHDNRDKLAVRMVLK